MKHTQINGQAQTDGHSYAGHLISIKLQTPDVQNCGVWGPGFSRRRVGFCTTSSRTFTQIRHLELTPVRWLGCAPRYLGEICFGLRDPEFWTAEVCVTKPGYHSDRPSPSGNLHMQPRILRGKRLADTTVSMRRSTKHVAYFSASQLLVPQHFRNLEFMHS